MHLGNTFNQLLGLTGMAALALSATIALAETNETIKIKVRTDEGLSETVSIKNLAEGATDVFTTESGKEVLVSRDSEGLTLEVDGQVIDVALPKVESLSGDNMEHHRVMFMSEDGLKHELDGDNEFVFITDDDEVHTSEGIHKRIMVTAGEGLHEACPSDEECKNVMIKRMHIDGDADAEWVDEEGTHRVIVKSLSEGDGELVEIQEIMEEMHLEGEGDGQVIIIEREIEVHEDDEENN
jgi:hypothetical protein